MSKAVANLVGKSYVPQVVDDEGNVEWEADPCDTHEEAMTLAESQIDMDEGSEEESETPKKATRATKKR